MDYSAVLSRFTFKPIASPFPFHIPLPLFSSDADTGTFRLQPSTNPTSCLGHPRLSLLYLIRLFLERLGSDNSYVEMKGFEREQTQKDLGH